MKWKDHAKERFPLKREKEEKKEGSQWTGVDEIDIWSEKNRG